MKLVAHRGWCAGEDENSLAAFTRATRDSRIAGVELDVQRHPGTGTLVVSHDAPAPGQAALTLDAALAYLATTELELLVELKAPDIAPAVVDRLVAAGVAHRSVVFAFPAIARSFPWHGARPARLGIIALYPWSIGRIVAADAPDVLMLGWDERAWTRLAFRAWWSVFSLGRLSRRYAVPVVVGVVRRASDLAWLARQEIDAAVADLDRLPGT